MIVSGMPCVLTTAQFVECYGRCESGSWLCFNSHWMCINRTLYHLGISLSIWIRDQCQSADGHGYSEALCRFRTDFSETVARVDRSFNVEPDAITSNVDRASHARFWNRVLRSYAERCTMSRQQLEWSLWCPTPSTDAELISRLSVRLQKSVVLVLVKPSPRSYEDSRQYRNVCCFSLDVGGRHVASPCTEWPRWSQQTVSNCLCIRNHASICLTAHRSSRHDERWLVRRIQQRSLWSWTQPDQTWPGCEHGGWLGNCSQGGSHVYSFPDIIPTLETSGCIDGLVTF